jgi:hypothetical protein
MSSTRRSEGARVLQDPVTRFLEEMRIYTVAYLLPQHSAFEVAARDCQSALFA